MREGIAVAGNMIVDHIKYIDRYPPEQTLANITGEARSTGGLACNVLSVLARLDNSLPLAAIGVVGGDADGDYVLSQLAALPSVDISRVARGGATSYTDVMTDARTGRRTFFHQRGANASLSPAHFDFKSINARILHIGYILLLDALDAPDPDYPTALCRVLHDARAAGIVTSVDVVSENSERYARLVPPALRYADYCVMNEHEAAMVTGIPLRDGEGRVLPDRLPNVCERLMAMGVGRAAVVHMPETAAGLTREGAYARVDSWKLPEGFIKSSVGAGDAFAAGVLHSVYNGLALDETLRAAGAVAAYSLSGAGAGDAIVPLAKLMKDMEAL